MTQRAQTMVELACRRYLESALRWQAVFEDGRGANDLTFADTLDLLCTRLVAALRSAPAPGGIEAREALEPSDAFTGTIVRFGFGLFGVDIGTLGDIPAVFIIPNENPGVVGERIPAELQGPLERDKVPNDWIVLTFPTRERSQEVADALVGSPLYTLPVRPDAPVGVREAALESAALDFIAKVDRGQARSKSSYAAFKSALALSSTPVRGDSSDARPQAPANVRENSDG